VVSRKEKIAAFGVNLMRSRCELPADSLQTAVVSRKKNSTPFGVSFTRSRCELPADSFLDRLDLRYTFPKDTLKYRAW